MRLNVQQHLALTTALAVLLYTMSPAPAVANEHVVPLAEIQKQVSAKAGKRAQDLADVTRVLSLPQAQQAFEKAKVNPAHAKAAVAQLDDQELARLAERARSAEKEVEGGIIIGLLALIGLVVVILIVIAVVRD